MEQEEPGEKIKYKELSANTVTSIIWRHRLSKEKDSRKKKKKRERKGSTESIMESIDKSQESIILRNDNTKNKNGKIEGLQMQENVNIKGKPGKVKC